VKKLEFMTEEELRHYMNALAGGIEFLSAEMGVEKPLFALVLFNDPAVGQYVANCQRADVIKALRETADRLERREDVPR
jgi:hypothetical protein